MYIQEKLTTNQQRQLSFMMGLVVMTIALFLIIQNGQIILIALTKNKMFHSHTNTTVTIVMDFIAMIQYPFSRMSIENTSYKEPNDKYYKILLAKI